MTTYRVLDDACQLPDEKRWILVGDSRDLFVARWWIAQPCADMVLGLEQSYGARDWFVYCTPEELRVARVAYAVVEPELEGLLLDAEDLKGWNGWNKGRHG